MQDATHTRPTTDAATVKPRTFGLGRARGSGDPTQHALEIARASPAFGRTDTPKSGLEVVVACHHDTDTKIAASQEKPKTLRFQLAADKARAFKVLRRHGGMREVRAAMKKDVQTTA